MSQPSIASFFGNPKKRPNTGDSIISTSNTPILIDDTNVTPPEASTSQNAASEKADVPKKKAKKVAFNRAYDSDYLRFGFTYINIGDEIRPKCIICSEILANSSMLPKKLDRHFQGNHKEYAGKGTEFFKRKLDENDKLIDQSQRAIDIMVRPKKGVIRASYMVALRVAKAKKPYTVAEELIAPCMNDVVTEILGEQAAKKVADVPLSDNTIKRRIDDMADDVEDQLITNLKNSPSKHFVLQLDESTDIANEAILIVFARFEYAGDFCEELLYSASLPTNTTAEEVFNTIDAYVKKTGLDWGNCVGICTDGAAAMIGTKSGVVTRIQAVAPSCVTYHCFLHREVLATKKLSSELNDVLTFVVKIVNFVKANALNSRLFAILCEDMGAEYTKLLYHTEVRWLSRGKVLKRVCEMRDELHVFLNSRKPEYAEHFRDVRWLAKLAYLADLFKEFNQINASIQGKMTTVFRVGDKIEATKKKLKLYIKRVQKLKFDMFDSVQLMIENELVSAELNLNELKVTIETHLANLVDNFEKYFPAHKDPRVGNGWIIAPFSDIDDNDYDLDIEEETMLIDLSSDSTLKVRFHEKATLQAFWIEARAEYRKLSEKALSVLLPFPTSYLCEQAFSQMAVLKNKHRNKLNVHSTLRLGLTNFDPRLDKLASTFYKHSQ